MSSEKQAPRATGEDLLNVTGFYTIGVKIKRKLSD